MVIMVMYTRWGDGIWVGHSFSIGSWEASSERIFQVAFVYLVKAGLVLQLTVTSEFMLPLQGRGLIAMCVLGAWFK